MSQKFFDIAVGRNALRRLESLLSRSIPII
jgi:hypothetical protein